MLGKNAVSILGLLAWAIVLPGGTLAADAPEPIDPAAAVRIALDNHPALRASAAGVDRARAQRDMAASGYFPRIDLSEDLVRSTNPVFVFASKLGQQQFTAADFALEALNRPDALTNSALRVSLRQNIWDAGRTIRGKKAAALGVDASEQANRRAEQEIAFSAQSAFWNLVVAGRMVEVAGDAEKAAQANLDLATELVDSGLAVPSDRMSAEVRLSEVQAMRIRAEQGLEVARAALQQALGVGAERRFEPMPPGGLPGEPADSLDSRIDEALSNRPDLARLERWADQSKIGEKMARSRRLPEIGAMAGYEWNGETFLGNDGENWTVGVGVKLALFDGTETRARIGEARARVAELESTVEAMRQAIRLQVQAAWADRVSAARRVEVADTALDRAAEALRIVRDRYGEGMAVMVELLAAEAAHTQARANQVAARGDLWLADAALDLASGRTFPAAASPGSQTPDRAASVGESGVDDEIR